MLTLLSVRLLQITAPQALGFVKNGNGHGIRRKLCIILIEQPSGLKAATNDSYDSELIMLVERLHRGA